MIGQYEVVVYFDLARGNNFSFRCDGIRVARDEFVQTCRLHPYDGQTAVELSKLYDDGDATVLATKSAEDGHITFLPSYFEEFP